VSEWLDWGALLAVSIGGVDRTADLIGAGEVDRELDAAGIAVVRLARGSAKPAVGAAVTISGIVAVPYVGVVSRVAYDPAGQWWVVSCTDELQEQFEGLATPAAVLALLPVGAIWHTDLHGEFRDGWAAAQDAMGTVPYSIFMEGGTLHAAPWAGTSEATTIAHASGGIYDGSVELDEADTRSLISALGATVQVRYARRHHWTLQMSWTLVQPPIDSTSEGPPYAGGQFNFRAWLREPCGLPTRDLIRAAVAGNSWGMENVHDGSGLSYGPAGLGIHFTGLPPSGIILADAFIPMDMAFTLRGCWPDIIWHNPSEEPGADLNEAAVIAAGWTLQRNWVQTLVEVYGLSVAATAGTVGATLLDAPASIDVPHDDAAWEATSSIIGVPAGLTPVVSGPHWYVDVVTAAEREAVLRGVVQTLATRIRRSQRQTVVRARVEPGAEPGLGTRCLLTAEDLAAAGQVVALHTAWDGDSGAAGCQVTLAVSSGTADDDFDPPTPPALTPAAAGYTLVSSIALGTHIGGHELSVPQVDPPGGGWYPVPVAEAWDGWVGNMVPTVPNTWLVDVIFPRPGAPIYNEGFSVQSPDVPDSARDEQTGAVTASYTIDPLAGTVTVL